MTEPNQYFATQNSTDLAADVMNKADDYYKFLQTTGLLTLWRRSYNAYFRGIETLGKMLQVGEQSEYTKIHINHYRNLLNHLLTMTTSKRPTFEPRAVNTDLASLSQCILAKGLLDYYMQEKKLSERHKDQTLDALLFGEGFIGREWKTDLGDEYAVGEDGKQIRNGDIKYSNYTPMDVIRDVYKNSSMEDYWKIVRPYENRFDLAAKYPELKDEILAVPTVSEDERYTRFFCDYNAESDDIPVFYFYHEKTASVPQGRLHICLDSDLVLFDGPLPYEKIPVTRMSAGNLKGTPFGYSIGYDLLSVQEAIDEMYGILLTNNRSFGVQVVMSPKGGGLATSQLAEGLVHLEYDSKLGKPEALNLTRSAPETYQLLQILEQVAETLSGVNSVARGNPEASLKSGAALALVQSMAIQFNMDLEESYVYSLEDNGTGTISMLRDFATVPRVAAIVGKYNIPYMKSFKGSDFNKISRVVVNMGSALTRTTAGKVEMAEKLLGAGFIDDPQQYIMVMTTGNFEPAVENEQRELMLIRSENENLAAGKPAQALATDRHNLHILEHASVLASPEAREDLTVVENTLAHIEEHKMLYQTLDPIIAGILKMAPIGVPPTGLPPIEGGNAEVAGPNMPTNPMTGEQWNPDTGGLPIAG